MLCLTRKLTESIIIGEHDKEIEIQVISIQRGRVVLGITAPKSVLVLRKELRDEKREG